MCSNIVEILLVKKRNIALKVALLKVLQISNFQGYKAMLSQHLWNL